MSEQMFAVAVRDGNDLFLWIRLRRAASGDLYYMFPTGRSGPEWKKWNPHGSAPTIRVLTKGYCPNRLRSRMLGSEALSKWSRDLLHPTNPERSL
jgi:hypothetical protein